MGFECKLQWAASDVGINLTTLLGMLLKGTRITLKMNIRGIINYEAWFSIICGVQKKSSSFVYYFSWNFQCDTLTILFAAFIIQQTQPFSCTSSQVYAT